VSATGKRVLTVDDSAAMRLMVCLALRTAGISVAEAEDGEVALKMARDERFSLLLIDFNMPNLDGPALIKELRDLPDYRFTPMIILTTETSSKKREQGIIAGATGWIVKPIQPEHLISTVKRLLD